MILTDEQIEEAIRHLEERKEKLSKLQALNEEVTLLELKAIAGPADIKLGVAKITEVVAEHYSLTTAAMHGASRHEHISKPRQEVFYLANKILHASKSEIARLFGKDHATVWHGIQVTEERISVDKAFQQHMKYTEEVCRRKLHLDQQPTQ